MNFDLYLKRERLTLESYLQNFSSADDALERTKRKGLDEIPEQQVRDYFESLIQNLSQQQEEVSPPSDPNVSDVSDQVVDTPPPPSKSKKV